MCNSVSSDPEKSRPEGARSRRGTLPGLGEVLAAIGERFDACGALAIVLVDATAFEKLERAFGVEAHRHAMGRLGALLNDTMASRMAPGDLLVRGETGRDEVLALLFRPSDDERVQTEELPAVHGAIRETLERHGSRLAYPYVKKAPPVHTGTAIALRNPTHGVESQLRRALAEARSDANLDVRLAARVRRSSFLNLLLKGDIYPVYEPIVEVATKTVHAYEALSRGPAGTDLHAPLAMFETAAEEDLLFQLDCLCRRKALEGARGLPEGTKLFLNIRPTTIHDPNFKADALYRTLEESQLKPSDLVFEISEQESIANFAIFREIRDNYGKLGFQIALDDTGAGYASLEAVLELSPEYIKVDRAFVSRIDEDPGRQELLRALDAVAGKIGARIIAEGLDTLDELNTLGDLGIPFGQGWLFGKPTPFRATRPSESGQSVPEPGPEPEAFPEAEPEAEPEADSDIDEFLFDEG
jgi:EAL domain-containing protein (putative c-di-GMP-specific phosphodiesterase class I)